MIPAALAILLGILGASPADPKGSLAKRLANPLSPGAVALLVADAGDPAVVARLEAALRDPRSETRAAAARVVMVAPVLELRNAVENALEAETDAEAAREEIRALVATEPSLSDGRLFAASDRFEGRLDPDLAKILARQRGPAAMPALLSARQWNLTPGEWAEAVWISSRGNPDALVPALARALGSGNRLRWGALLRMLVRKDVVAGRNVVAAGLRTNYPDMAGRAAWYMTWVRLKEPLSTDRALVETLTPPEGSDVDTAYFFDLLGRTFSEPAGDSAAWIAFLPTAQRSFADTIDGAGLWLDVMTPAEREAVLRRNFRRDPRSLVPASKPAGATKPPNLPNPASRPHAPKTDDGFTLRTVSGLPRGVAADALAVGKCRPKKGQIFGMAAVLYGPDGRPRAVRPYETWAPDACDAVAGSLVMLTLAGDDEFPVGSEPTLLFGMARADCLAALEEADVCPSVCPEDRDAVYRVGGNVKAPELVEKVEPKYPGHWRREGKEGVVVIEAIVSEEGCVQEARVLKRADVALDVEAARAVTQWKYRPATKDGIPVRVYLTVTVTYRLN